MSQACPTLARLRWWHIEQILPVERDLFGAQQWSAAMFWNELANGHHYIGAFDGDHVVGYAGMALNPPDEAWVNNVAVRRDCQHRGVGRLLLTELLSVARANGVRHTLLEVAADNTAAQKLYDGFGFEVIGVRRAYYQPGNTDALVMRRDAP